MSKINKILPLTFSWRIKIDKQVNEGQVLQR